MLPEHDAELRDWFRVGNRLRGKIYGDRLALGNHPLPDGTAFTTSKLLCLDETANTAATLSGMRYLLKNPQT
jgi:hypothetical protein